MDRPDFDPGFSTPRMTAVWSAEARVKRMVEVELALADAAASVGLVPESAAITLRTACVEPIADPAALLTEGWQAGSPVIPLMAALRARVSPEVGACVHFGATSQDVIDTATALMLRDAFIVFGESLAVLADGLYELMTRHPDAWAMGRTLLQPALPLLFSARVARWLDPVLWHAEVVRAARLALPVQLGGPVGDLRTFGGRADAVVTHFAAGLGLSTPPLPWHTDRTVVVHAVHSATGIAASVAAVAADLMLLSQAEIGEVRMSPGASSAMPHKKNPHQAVRSIAAARACQGTATIITGAPPHELERAAGSWQAEWFALPLVMHTAAAALDATVGAVSGVVFDVDRARANLREAPPADRTSGDRLVERVAARYRVVRGRGA